jgi:cyclohexa-1,5-dienecarbonyl-CoA hydratase
MSGFKFLQYERTGDLIRIAINRPPFNVLDIATMAEMNLALDRALEEQGAKALMLTGVGEKAFSAGVDVADHTKDKVSAMIETFHGNIKRVLAMPIPTVAAINGAALGGGCEFAIACDMVVAAEGAKLGQPEIKLGVFPPIAAILMPRIAPTPRAMELVLGGGIIDAREAHAIGLVNKVYPRETFVADTAKFLEQFLSLSRAALVYAKHAMREATGRPFHEALHHVEQIYLKDMMATEDATEGLNAFMEKRKPVWKNR